MSQIVQLDSLGAPERLEVRGCVHSCVVGPTVFLGFVGSAGFSAVACAGFVQPVADTSVLG